MPMPVVSKGRLKRRMLEYFREVERTRVPLIVTDRGREVLEIRPVERTDLSAADLLALYRGAEDPSPAPTEKALKEPLPLDDWEVERKLDRNPW